MIQINDLEAYAVYRIKSRNLVIGVWSPDKQGFIGIREKFSSRYLFTEYLSRECGGTAIPYDTATPLEKIGTVDQSVLLEENLERVCSNCGNRAWWTGPPIPAPWACEGNCDEKVINGYSPLNRELFDILDSFPIPPDEAW